MADPQTAQDFFGSSAAQPNLPSAQQFFAPEPQAGAAQDTVWSSLQTAGSHVLNAVGYGAKDAWGAKPLGLSPEAESALRKVGIFNDYQAGHDSLVKSFNEAIIRPAASAADAAIRAPSTILHALGAGGEQAETELQGPQNQNPGLVRRGLAGVVGAAGELAHGAGEGAIFPELSEAGAPGHAGAVELPPEAVERSAGASPEAAPETAAAALAAEEPSLWTPEREAAWQSQSIQQASEARAAGVVGEGEAGFYEATPPTPEDLAARQEAAKDAGMDATPPPPPPAPDIHALARRIDPETFERYDALEAERDTWRSTLSALGDTRESHPEAIEAQAQIDTILGKVNGVESRLTNAARERLGEAQHKLDDLLTNDTPAMESARQMVMQADFEMRDLAPQVSEAYRHAGEMLPEQPAIAPSAEPGAEPTPKPAETEAEAVAKPEAEAEAPAAAGPQAARGAPVVAANGELEAATAPPNVLGDQTLGAKATEGVAKKAGASHGNLKTVEGTGDLKTRSLSEGVEAKAIEDGLTSTFGDLPEYHALSMAEQADAAAKLIAKDYEHARAVAMGDRQPPKGLLPESVFVAVEKHALATGDVETLRQLGTRSKLSSAATTMGQRIRTLGERDAASPVGRIQEVQTAREEALKAKNVDIEAAKREAVTEIKAEMKKAATVKPDAWADFLATIRCDS